MSSEASERGTPAARREVREGIACLTIRRSERRKALAAEGMAGLRPGRARVRTDSGAGSSC